MARMKTFFIYFLLVVLFFIYSKVMIYIAINTTYNYKNVDIKSTSITYADVKATSVNGIANVKVKGDNEINFENKYLKIQCYSNNNTVMGTKYIEIGKINNTEEKEFEIRFKYNRVEKAIVDIVEIEQIEQVKDEDKKSDDEMKMTAMLAAVVLLFFFG